MSLWRTFFLKVVPIFVFALQVAFSLSEVQKFLGINDSLKYQLGLGVFIIVGFGLYHVKVVIRPYDKEAELALKRSRIMDGVVEQFSKSTPYELRFNVMLARHKYFQRLEPPKHSKNPGFDIYVQCLEPVWVSQNMRQAQDRSIVFTVDQGVSGEAYQKEKLIFADLTSESEKEYNLNSDQKIKTKDVRFVLSVPIRELDMGEMGLGNEIIGVLNIDSLEPGSETLLEDTRAYESLRRTASWLSRYSSNLFP